MYLYLIYDPQRDYHKIGITKNLVRRLRQLQTGNGGALHIKATFASPLASLIERSLHRYYGDDRRVGEWFDLPAGEATRFLVRCQQMESFHKAALVNTLGDELLA